MEVEDDEREESEEKESVAKMPAVSSVYRGKQKVKRINQTVKVVRNIYCLSFEEIFLYTM